MKNKDKKEIKILFSICRQDHYSGAVILVRMQIKVFLLPRCKTTSTQTVWFLTRIQKLVIVYVMKTMVMKHNQRVLLSLKPHKSCLKLLHVNFPFRIGTLQSHGTRRRGNLGGIHKLSICHDYVSHVYC